MFIVQCLDLDEGSGARWHDIKSAKHETREAARAHARRMRDTDDECCLYLYRTVEIGSDAYYSQPTDSLEW